MVYTHRNDPASPANVNQNSGRRGRVLGHVAAVVGGVGGPAEPSAEGDGHHEEERRHRHAPVHGVVHREVAVVQDLVGQEDEQDGQYGGAPGLQPVDELVAEEADQTLEDQHHRHADGERHVEEDLGGLPAEQTDQGIPGHRRDPLHQGRDRDGLAEGEPGQRQLGHAGLRAPQREGGHRCRTQQDPDGDGGDAGGQPEPQGGGQRAGEHPGQLHVGGEPDREVAPVGAVAAVLGDGDDAGRFEGQVALSGGPGPVEHADRRHRGRPPSSCRGWCGSVAVL